MGFFLTETFDAPPETDVHGDDLRIPCRDRRPTDPGFVLTYKEFDHGAGQTWQDATENRGIVQSLGPRARSVWVIPDVRHEGDGFFVLVDSVTRDDPTWAIRRRGHHDDRLSTSRWQSPRTSLPRAFLRVDHLWTGEDGDRRPVALVHRDAACPEPPPAPFMDIRVERGEATELDTCYVDDDTLHPMSLLPAAPPGSTRIVMGLDPYARPCGVCLRPGKLLYP